jgi:hypothetical protein
MLAFIAILSCTEADPGQSGKDIYPNNVESDRGSYQVVYSSDPEPIPLNEEFSLDLAVYGTNDQSQPLQDVELLASAEMPEHSHGMPQEPLMESNGDGTYTASGMLFQMSGYWEILVWVTGEGPTELAVFSVDCCE